MSIPKKKSRTITVDGKSYRFLIKHAKPMGPLGDHDDKDLSVTIQEDGDKPGNVVQFRAGYGGEIMPRDIEHNIRQALKNGWSPDKRGAAVQLEWEWANR